MSIGGDTKCTSRRCIKKWKVVLFFFSYLRLRFAHHETLEDFLELCKLGGQVCRLLCDPLNLDIQVLLS